MTSLIRVKCSVCGGEVERPRDVWPDVRAMPARLERAVRGVDASVLERRPAPGEWSPREILAHLTDVEVAIGYRLCRVIAENGKEIQPFDEEAWADALAYHRREPRLLLRAFRSLRAASLDLLAGLTPAEWERAGRHPEYGPMTAAQIFGHRYDHDRIHLEQLRRAVAGAEG
jgi:hypothetical protein